MRTWLEVDFGQIRKNIDIVKSTLPKGCDMIAVVKANAYGHGDIFTAKKLQSYGIRRFAVACIDEALALKNAGVGGELIILGYTDPQEALFAAKGGFTVACVSPDHLKELSAAALECELPLKLNLAINTGMNRIGFECKTEKDLADIASAYTTKHENLEIRGMFSHFSSSDDLSEGADEYTLMQLSRFEKVISYLKERGIDPGFTHISNSGAIGKYPQARFDAVRCGALLYGYNTAMDAKLPVEPAMTWKTKVSVVRTIDKGDAVSYSRKFIASGLTTIATIGVGYADGMMRSLSNKGFVLINGCKAPMIGNMCMDQMMVDISGIPGVVPGTEAVLIGRSGSLVQTADDLADAAGTCMHEILSSIGLRVERYYK